MTSHVDGPQEADVLASVVELARNSVQPATPVQLGEGWRNVSARLTVHKAKRRWLLRWSLLGAAATTCALLAVGAVWLSRARSLTLQAAPLAYEIEGGQVIEGGYLHESGDVGIKMVFAEGTEFVLTPGSRGRLRAVDSRGAHIAIEKGSASFQVTPRNEARWLVDVGPFLVTVKGTVFTVFWDAAAERFELRLQHGRVSVSGPVSGGEIALRSGQRLVVDLPKAETVIAGQKPENGWQEQAEAVASPLGTDEPAGASERPAVRSPTGLSPAPLGRTDGERRWADALAAGRWDRILADVERAGVKATLEKASSEDLFTLADAARYRSRTELARAALLAERRRFPHSARALDAAFLLGRIEESNGHGTRRALRWYDEYLARTPAGTYAAEALGRKMIVTTRLEGAMRAQPIAEEYLRRFPNGTYAGSARALRWGH
jgi:TolA-binding protein